MNKEGWGQVLAIGIGYSKNEHYFRDGRALCGRYMRFSDEDLHPTSFEKCKACSEKIDYAGMKKQTKRVEIEFGKGDFDFEDAVAVLEVDGWKRGDLRRPYKNRKWNYNPDAPGEFINYTAWVIFHRWSPKKEAATV